MSNKSKKTICCKCDVEIGVGMPFSSNFVGDTFCIECASIILEKQNKIEREIAYNNRNICLRCNVKSDGPFINDSETDRPICLKCVKIGESGYTYNVL